MKSPQFAKQEEIFSLFNIPFYCNKNKDKYINIDLTSASVNKIIFYFHNDNEHKCSIVKISGIFQSMETLDGFLLNFSGQSYVVTPLLLDAIIFENGSLKWKS